MVRDARLLDVAMPPSAQEVESDLLRLIEANGRPDGTLRLVVVRNTGGAWAGPHSDNRPSDVIALTADLKDWPNGVRLGIQPNARFAANEFAGAKILSWAQNLAWAERAQESGYDEVILLNERGTVAECTSANIFARPGRRSCDARAGRWLSARYYARDPSEAIHVEGLRIVERCLTLEDLYRANEVFITSTTRDLLPVHEIAGRATGGDCEARLKLLAAFGEFHGTISRSGSGRLCTSKTMPVACPNCGSRFLRESRPRSFSEKIGKLRFISPVRCVDCKTRFIARTLMMEDLRFARCPRCFRMDLSEWTGKNYLPPLWMRLKLNFGAWRWRCEYCRLNFVSFRKRKEIFSFSRWKKMNAAQARAEGRAKAAALEAIELEMASREVASPD